MMDWDRGRMGAGWGIAMMLGMLLLWAVIALVVVWIVRATRSPHGSMGTPRGTGGAPTGAEQILAERLARGEIEPEDYRARMAALAQKP